MDKQQALNERMEQSRLDRLRAETPLTGLRLLRWKAALRLYRLGCAVSGRHRALLVWDPDWKELYCPHCGWFPEEPYE